MIAAIAHVLLAARDLFLQELSLFLYSLSVEDRFLVFLSGFIELFLQFNKVVF